MYSFLIRDECPVCSSTRSNILIDKSYGDEAILSFLNSYYKNRIKYEVIKDSRYVILECKNCRTFYQKYIFNEKGMNSLYEEYIDPLKSLKKKESSSFQYFQSLIKDSSKASLLCEKIFKNPPRKIKVLDFGMGWGNWLLAAKACGLKVYGTELSQPRISFAQKNGLEIIDPFTDVYNNFFHFINADQVFEHLAEPKIVLNELSRKLKKNGIIKISVPNPRGSIFRLKYFKKNWRPSKGAIQPLEHINAFSYKSLCNLSNNCNLKPMKPSLVENNLHETIRSKIKLSLNIPMWYFQKK